MVISFLLNILLSALTPSPPKLLSIVYNLVFIRSEVFTAANINIVVFCVTGLENRY
jgi:hypothetical protein